MEGLIAIIFLCFVALLIFPVRIASQPGPIFNVLDFGAAADTKTDDSQACLDKITISSVMGSCKPSSFEVG